MQILLNILVIANVFSHMFLLTFHNSLICATNESQDVIFRNHLAKLPLVTGVLLNKICELILYLQT